jgi:uncharacterized protein involved in response to NO
VPLSERSSPVWPPFVRAASGLALVGGFGLGGALGLALWQGLPLGTWWLAASQAHGHVQLVGWAGLVVLGVGLHFMPRLRGAPLARPALARPALGLLAGGLAARLVAQPALALGGSFRGPWWALLVLSGVAELAGAVVVIGMLAVTARNGPPLDARAGLRPVLPFFALGLASLLAALAVGALGLAAVDANGLVDGRLDAFAVRLALEGFLVPTAVGMSMRTFSLYFRTHLPRLGTMRVGLALWVGGPLLDVAGGEPLGLAAQAAGVACWVIGLGVFGRRQPRPRDPTPAWAPIPLHARAAYGWLVIAALLKTGRALALLGGPALAAGPDAERHALGAGFVTLLIFGVGAEMLPGFARRPLRHPGLPWATLVLGNAAALLRAAAALAPDLGEPALGALIGAAGLCGIAAVACFAIAMPTRPQIGGPR